MCMRMGPHHRLRVVLWLALSTGILAQPSLDGGARQHHPSTGSPLRLPVLASLPSDVLKGTEALACLSAV